MPTHDIPIGRDKVISWVTLDWRYDTAVPIDDLIPEADWFWPALEGHCVSDCCGIAAFDVTPEGIRWAVGDDIPPPAEISWRPDEQGDVVALVAQLDEAIAKVEALDADVVSSRAEFNQLFDTRVFIELMTHIASVLRRARGHEVVT